MTTTTLQAAPTASARYAFVRRHAALFVIYGLLLVMVVLASLFSERFLTERNFANLLRQAGFLGIVAIGQTVVILSGGIDLSVGSVIKLSVLVAALVMNGHESNTALAIGLVLLMGVLVGMFNAMVITRLRVAPFIATLGVYSILRGISFAITTKPIGRASPFWLSFYDSRIGPLAGPAVVFFVLLVVMIVVLRRTRFGRYVYAVGGSEQVARLSGIPITRVKYGVYIICSALAALTGLLYLSRMGVGDPVVGDGLELQSITAVILGGTSLAGGRGGLIGTLGGVLLLALTANLLVILNVNQWIQELIQGLIIISAVALYKQKNRR
jgi:ribose transport system permease protein